MDARIRRLALPAAAWCLVGCSPAPRPGPSPDAVDPPLAAARWPFWPTDMRVHPLSRLVTDPKSGGQLVEARIEFLDPEGHTTKAWGRLRLDLHDASGSQPFGALATWNLDLDDGEFNRERYDVVTRTYVFPLEVVPRDLGGRPELRANFFSADGTQLEEAAMELRTE